MSPTDDWTAKIKETMAVDVSRGMRDGLDGRAIVEMLFAIPEVAQAVHLRARSKLDIDIDTAEGQAIAAERIEWVANFLDDGFHETAVTTLREVAGDLTELG
jgi:hypothetical protein